MTGAAAPAAPQGTGEAVPLGQAAREGGARAQSGRQTAASRAAGPVIGAAASDNAAGSGIAGPGGGSAAPATSVHTGQPSPAPYPSWGAASPERHSSAGVPSGAA